MPLFELNRKLSKDLRAARLRKGISLPAAARVLKIAEPQIIKIETNPIRVPVCDLFKVIQLYELPEETLWQLRMPWKFLR